MSQLPDYLCLFDPTAGRDALLEQINQIAHSHGLNLYPLLTIADGFSQWLQEGAGGAEGAEQALITVRSALADAKELNCMFIDAIGAVRCALDNVASTSVGVPVDLKS